MLVIMATLIDYSHMPSIMKAAIGFKGGYIVHFGAYFFASYLIWVSFESIIALVLGLNSSIFFLSVILEFLQKLTPSRRFNKVDVLMNLAGLVCFNLVLFFFLFLKKKKSQKVE